MDARTALAQLRRGLEYPAASMHGEIVHACGGDPALVQECVARLARAARRVLGTRRKVLRGLDDYAMVAVFDREDIGGITYDHILETVELALAEFDK